MTILWILNLFNGTGLGMVYQTTEKTRSLIYIAAIFIIIMKCREHHLWVDNYIWGNGIHIYCRFYV